MRISDEAIYQALYIQGRGALRRELSACLRSGRALRLPRERAQNRGKAFIADALMISDRPAEIDDRAVPGHWEGDVRLTHRMVEIFHNHERVALHTRRGTRGGHSNVREHMPKAHQRHGGMTPEYQILRAGRLGHHVAILVERLMRDRPQPEQGYCSALGVLNLERRFGRDRLEAACDRALTYNTVSYASVQSILATGLDRTVAGPAPIPPTPHHDNIRGAAYYH